VAAPILTASLLAQPALTTARLMARSYLQRVLEDAARVEVSVDELTEPTASLAAARQRDAVHDLHVALRRLRSWLRAWRPFLRDTLGRNSERRLKKLSRLAGQVRDLELQRDWLISHRVQRSRLGGATARSMVGRVETEYAEAHRALAARLLKRLGRAVVTLNAELQDLGAADDEIAAAPTTALEMARLIADHADGLPKVLKRVRRSGQGDGAHAARIAVRRFRYLLDTLGRRSPDVRLVTRHLTNVQIQLGELHDAQVLAVRLKSTSKKAKKSGRSRSKGNGVTRTGVATLQAMLRQRIARESRLVRRTIGGSGQARVVAASARIVARLSRFNAVR
jgi:CHAD domain-containing protein